MKIAVERIFSVLRIAFVLSAVCVLKSTTFAASFTAGNLAVLRAESNTLNNTTASIIELDPNTAAQSPSNIIAIPGTGSTALRISGSASSTGYLSHTDDRSLITFNGVNTTNTSSNVNGLNPRGVGTLDNSGTYALPATYTGTTSGNPQTRSSSSLNNTTWYFGDQNGMYSNGTVAPSPAGNIRSVKAFGGAMYTFTASASAPPVNTINAPTGGTLTALPGLANGTTAAQDFYMVQSGDNGSAYDVLYVLSASGATAGTIAKHSLVSGSWTANGSYTTDFGGFGLAAIDDGNGANLFVSTGTGASAANSVLKLIDTAGFNLPISITTANNVTLYTAPAGTTLKGVDFAPLAAAVPEPSSLALIAIGMAFSFRRGFRRK